MAKKSGLGDNFYLGGPTVGTIACFDLSGDVAVLNTVGGGPEYIEVPGINVSGQERIGGIRDGEIGFNVWFNDATDQEHGVLSALPTADVYLLYFRGTALGDPAAAMIAKQVNYGWARGADGSLRGSVRCLDNGYGMEWGRSVTAGKRTDTGATNGSGVDDGTLAAAVNITSSSVANPTVITTAAAHGLNSNDRVLIAGHTGSTPDINGVHVATVLTGTTFTIPVNVTVGGTGGTATRISSRFGLAAYLQYFAFAGTSATVKLQESSDDAATDPYADVTGGAFTAITGGAAPGPERIQTSLTQNVERWLRCITTGTFTNLVFAVAYVRHLTAVGY